MKPDNGEQRLSRWTQQLHDKLAEHETAAPEGLWSDIEAALAQQPEAAPLRPRSRFVAWRWWAVAASIAALLIGGGYLWWNENEAPGEELLAQTSLAQAPQVQASQAQAPPVQPLPAPQGEGLGSVAPPPTTVPASSLSNLQTPSPTSPLEGKGVAEKPEVAALEKREVAIHEEPEVAALEKREVATHKEPELLSPAKSVPSEPAAWSSMLAHRDSPASSHTSQPSFALYAMNGLGNQNSSNGVQMADALAKQYMETYMNSYDASARSSEPIYLTGYEERQHHHRPVTYGLTLSYPLTDRLALTTGVVYTKLQSEFTQIMRSQQIQQEQTLHYVGIPLSLSYKLWIYKSFSTYLSAGARADWNVKTHLETEGASQQLPKDRMQWSLNGSLGLQYDIVPQVGLYAEPSLNWYPDNGSAIQNYFKDKPLSLGLQVGLRLNMR